MMRTRMQAVMAAVALLAGLVSWTTMAQDDVTIPKSRLKELEAKEAELERLKGKQVVSPQAQPPVAAPLPPHAAPAVPAHQSPAFASLPPLKEGDVVDAADLANYYHMDRAAADKRFRKRKIVVRGEVIGFEKPILSRNYRVLLAGADRDSKVTCDLVPPEKYSAVFTVDDGAQIVGLQGETRVPLAKVGNSVLVEGICQGWKKSAVQVAGIDLKVAR